MSAERLCIAARDGMLTEVRRLVEQEKIDPNAEAYIPAKSYTPLVEACRFHHLAVVQYLVEEAQVDIRDTDGDGNRILFLTCHEGLECLPVIRYLVETVGLSVHGTNAFGCTLLHDACVYGNLALIQYLIEQAHSDIDIKNLNGNTPLHSVCDWGGHESLPIIRYLIESAGSDVHATNRKGRTPLHLACCSSKLEFAKYLVEHGKAKVDAMDIMGESPLVELFYRNDPPRDWLILLFLTKVDSVHKKVFHLAWYKDKPWDVKEMVLRKYAVRLEVSEALEEFPLHTLIQQNLLTYVLEECVEKFPTTALFLFDHDGRLPLHVALMKMSGPNHDTSCLWRLVYALTRRFPESLLLRDPITGMSPLAIAALVLSRTEDNSAFEACWLDTVFEVLRMNPGAVCHAGLHCRRLGKGVANAVSSGSY